MHRIDTDRQSVLPLIEGMEHHLSVHAFAAGTMPGWMYVDDPAAPRTAFAFNNEGWYLIGDGANERFLEWLVPLIRDEVVPGARAHGEGLIPLHFHPQDWEPLGTRLLPGQPFHIDFQHYFRCSKPEVEWRAELPAGLAVRGVDAGVLEREDDPVVAKLRRWAQGAFGSLEAFVEAGLGRIVEHEGRIVSWCMPDCVAGRRCEVGIHTLPEFRRRGLAACAVAATVEGCLERGFEWVGWHCWSENEASANLAQKVGFRLVCDHSAFMLHLRER